MFATENYVQARRGKKGTPRFCYLQKLVTEYQDTNKIEYQQQIIANLANFAYDPYNYVIMKELNIIDLFIDGLTEEDDLIKEFAIGGICNCICDDFFANVILDDKGAMKSIIKLLSSSNENTLISTLTTLFYICDLESSHKYLKKDRIRKAVQTYADCGNAKISNIAKGLRTKLE